MNSSIKFHNKISKKFSNKYDKKKIFIERYIFLTNKCKELLKKQLNKNIKILDYGCGSGVFSVPLSNYGRVTGIDGSRNMIELAKAKVRKKKIKNINLKLLDLNNYVTNEKFELIFCSSVLEYFDNFAEHLEKLNNMLTDNGTLLISMPNSKSFYRVIEKVLFNILKMPKYYEHVKINKDENYYKKLFRKKNYSVKEVNYFSVNLRILNYLPLNYKFKCNMILFVLTK